jgi:hypothetical protein
MIDLGKKLVEEKKIAESSSSLYIKNLWTLNNKQPFNNLAFLKNHDVIDKLLAEYADNTKKTYLSSIVSVLSLFKDKATYKRIYEHYYKQMMDKADDMKKEEKDTKTDKQSENWMDWNDVMRMNTILLEEVNKFVRQQTNNPPAV